MFGVEFPFRTDGAVLPLPSAQPFPHAATVFSRDVYVSGGEPPPDHWQVGLTTDANMAVQAASGP